MCIRVFMCVCVGVSNYMGMEKKERERHRSAYLNEGMSVCK